jgi:hypothetical protein
MKKKTSNAPFTLQLSKSQHDSLLRLQKRRKLGTKTLAILHALRDFDFTKLKREKREPVQISFRVTEELSVRLTRNAIRAGVSTGEIVRRALEAAK